MHRLPYRKPPVFHAIPTPHYRGVAPALSISATAKDGGREVNYLGRAGGGSSSVVGYAAENGTQTCDVRRGRVTSFLLPH